ncbi:MAG: alpha/beta hydrolase [Burkholderiales bacterium]|nr:alpha/beta hydrolase [Burkholderiales bacterium]
MTKASDSTAPLVGAAPGAAEYIATIEAAARQGVQRAVARLSYGPAPGQQLDVYVPPQRDRHAAPLPVLIFFHGGAWIRGGLDWLDFMAPAVTALPAVFVAGTYRLAPENRWPAQHEDVQAAIRRVHERIGEFGGDAGRIAVGGHSAGGHLAAMAVLAGDVPPLRACLPVSAPCDLRYGDIPIDSDDARAYKYLLQRREQDAEASPVVFVAGNRVPFHLVWGERDFRRIRDGNPVMLAALHAAGCEATHAAIAGAGHFDTHLMLSDPANAWYERVREMLG